MVRITVLVLSFILVDVASAEIRETKRMTEALSLARPGDVVVLDIDNTTLEPNQSLVSDQWYAHTVDQLVKSGLSRDEAIDRAIARVIRVQPKTKVHPVESDTPALIQWVQARGISVYFLTARPLELKEVSLRQLNSVGVYPRGGGVEFSKGNEVELYNGILLVGPRNNKGLVLAQFFKEKGIKHRQVIFVDDKEGHVKNMEAIFASNGIANLNFRYGAADEKVKAFRPEIADVQWAHFEKTGEILSDDEADRLL